MENINITSKEEFKAVYLKEHSVDDFVKNIDNPDVSVAIIKPISNNLTDYDNARFLKNRLDSKSFTTFWGEIEYTSSNLAEIKTVIFVLIDRNHEQNLRKFLNEIIKDNIDSYVLKSVEMKKTIFCDNMSTIPSKIDTFEHKRLDLFFGKLYSLDNLTGCVIKKIYVSNNINTVIHNKSNLGQQHQQNG